jgi:hypothetical protein
MLIAKVGEMTPHKVLRSSDLIWRRLIGALAMAMGGALLVAMPTLAGILLANLVQPAHAFEIMTNIALITVPGLLVGLGLAFAGRLLYGEWLERAPARKVAAGIMRAAGAVTAFGLGIMLVILIVAGIDPQDRGEAVLLGLGMLAGLAITLIGFWMKPRRIRRRYEED